MDKLIIIEGTTNIGEITYVRTNKPDLNSYAARKRNKFCDVTITSQGISFSANKMVLSCNSLYFEKIFDVPMQEMYSGSVEVERVDATSMGSVIDYIYNGKIKINEANVCKLLDAAEYLQIGDLKDDCITYLQKAINCKNCYTLRLLADRSHSDILSDCVKSFMRDNFVEILSRDEYKELTEEEFCFLFSARKNLQVNKMTLYKTVVEWIKFELDDRKDRFLEVLEKVDLKLRELPLQFLIDNVVQEKFIQQNEKFTAKVCETIKMSSKDNLLIIGGDYHYKEVIQYNISFNKFTELQELPEGRRSHRCMTLKDVVYVIGGLADDRITKLSTVYRMSMSGNPPTWEQVKSMNTARFVFGAAVYENLIYVVGGDWTNTLRSGEYYSPATDIWNNIKDMNQERYGHELVQLKGHLYAIGGDDRNDEVLNTVEKYDPQQNEWKSIAAMQTARIWFVATATDDAIYVMGGHDGEKSLNSTEKYDVINDVWTNLKDMIIGRDCFSGCLLQNKIYIVGGANNKQAIYSIHNYVIEEDNWEVVADLNDKHYNHSFVAV